MPTHFKAVLINLLSISIILLSHSAFANADNIKEITKPNEIRHVKISDDLFLDIYVPPNASQSKLLPTLYVMDSQHYMYNAIGYQKSLRTNVNVSPEYIVVGINTSQVGNNRNVVLGRDADKIISLIKNSIVPYIDLHYPSSQQRMYFGWQFAAMLGLKMFNTAPELFEAYFLASGQHYSQEQLTKLEQSLKNNPKLKRYFYLSLGEMERHTLAGHKAMVALFEQARQANINWKFSYFDRFSKRYDHHTTPLESLTHGLEWYFSDYPDLTFYSVEDIANFGGAEAVKSYYENRAKRYQISADVGEQTQFSMFRHAARANDYALYQSFEQVLGKYDVQAWYGFFAEFYLKNKAIDRAEDTYKKSLKAFPEDPNNWAGMANVYELQRKYEKAIHSYQRAIEYINKTDSTYAKYQKHITRLSKMQ